MRCFGVVLVIEVHRAAAAIVDVLSKEGRVRTILLV
jgi:phosphosulfolactate phosphohydrolase-like enzyme